MTLYIIQHKYNHLQWYYFLCIHSVFTTGPLQYTLVLFALLVKYSDAECWRGPLKTQSHRVGPEVWLSGSEVVLSIPLCDLHLGEWGWTYLLVSWVSLTHFKKKKKPNIFQASTMQLSGLKMFNFVLEFRRISHKWAPRNYKKPACKPCCFVYILTTPWVRKYGCKINTFSAIFVSQPWDWLAE